MKEIDLKNKTVLKIVENAIELFNINGYSGTSISEIAKKAKLSKGILYHYFRNKDDLYLFCTRMCIDEYLDFLQANLKNPASNTDLITENVRLRMNFFEQNPQYRILYNYIISKKPNHLSSELMEIRKKLIDNNTEQIKKNISEMDIGDGIFEDDIISFIEILQNTSAFLFVETMDEETKNAKIDSVVRITKIFLNGLRTGLE